MKTKQAELKRPVVFDELEYDVLVELVKTRRDELSVYSADDEDFGPEISILASILEKLQTIKQPVDYEFI
jgi:hypothetical protein